MSPDESRPGNPEAARNAFDGNAFDGAVASVAESPRCLCCRRPLSDPSSVRRGYGRVCFGRVRLDQHAAMVAVVRQRIDQLSMTVDVLAADQLEAVDAALADLLGHRPGVIA